MESRIVQVRAILNHLLDQNGGSPRHSGKGSFWNLSRDQFVNGPIYGETPIMPGHPEQSFLISILSGNVYDSDGTLEYSQMPLGGPYISAGDLAFIVAWIKDGAPDADAEFMREYHLEKA